MTINNVSMRFAVLCRCVLTGCFALQGLLHAVSEWMFHVGQSRWIVIVLLGVLASRSGHCSRRFMRFLAKFESHFSAVAVAFAAAAEQMESQQPADGDNNSKGKFFLA